MSVEALRSGDSLVSRTVDAVRAYMRTEGLKVGDPLPGEGHFAETIGVSRAVIREAFGKLAALRLIDVANGRRARVGALDGSVIATSLDHAMSTSQISIADVWEVRRTLEMRTAALAAQNRTDGEANTIVALADQMATVGAAGGDVTAQDIAFHAAIAEASRNALFVQIVSSFAPLMEVAVPAAWATRDAQSDRDMIMGHHRALADAIRRRDAAAAAASMAAHFNANIGIQLGASGG